VRTFFDQIQYILHGWVTSKKKCNYKLILIDQRLIIKMKQTCTKCVFWVFCEFLLECYNVQYLIKKKLK